MRGGDDDDALDRDRAAQRRLAGGPGQADRNQRRPGPGRRLGRSSSNVREPPVFALITREPAASRPSSSYYLERALVPAADQRVLTGRPRASSGSTRSATIRDSLATADLLVLDHPGRLSDELHHLAGGLAPAWPLGLLRRLRAGRCGQPQATGRPGRHRSPAAGRVRSRRHAGGTRTAAVHRRPAPRAPPFPVFGDAVTATLAPLRFCRCAWPRTLPERAGRRRARQLQRQERLPGRFDVRGRHAGDPQRRSRRVELAHLLGFRPA